MASDESTKRRRHSLISAGVGATLFAVAIYFLHREFAKIDVNQAISAIADEPIEHILLAILLTAASYTVLTCFDTLAMRYGRHRIRYPKIAYTSFIAYALALNIGFAWLTGGSIRLRFYTQAGLTPLQVAGVILFCSFTFALGAVFLIGWALLLGPQDIIGSLGIPHSLTSVLGGGLIALVVAYWLANLVRRQPFLIAGRTIPTPGPAISALQILLATADLVLAASVIYVLLPSEAHLGYFTFLGLFVLAFEAGLISNVPGGIGIFETILFLALPDVPKEPLLTAILTYRLIYYVAPLTLAVGLLARHEIVEYRRANAGAND